MCLGISHACVPHDLVLALPASPPDRRTGLTQSGLDDQPLYHAGPVAAKNPCCVHRTSRSRSLSHAVPIGRPDLRTSLTQSGLADRPLYHAGPVAATFPRCAHRTSRSQPLFHAVPTGRPDRAPWTAPLSHCSCFRSCQWIQALSLPLGSWSHSCH